jgi:hypothetical protein
MALGIRSWSTDTKSPDTLCSSIDPEMCDRPDQSVIY